LAQLPPLTSDDLRGKVVLVDFWTYTCINWLRTLGHIRTWADKYEGHGLVVVGVHTPEFPFERDIDNVRDAAEEMRVDYPVALDSDYAVWEAFDNHYWPAVYIADAEGHPPSSLRRRWLRRVRDDHPNVPSRDRTGRVGCVNSVRRGDLWICREIGFMDARRCERAIGAGGQRHRNR
jgi:thiol-disulfide isomerase/thioredoxin